MDFKTYHPCRTIPIEQQGRREKIPHADEDGPYRRDRIASRVSTPRDHTPRHRLPPSPPRGRSLAGRGLNALARADHSSYSDQAPDAELSYIKSEHSPLRSRRLSDNHNSGKRARSRSPDEPRKRYENRGQYNREDSLDRLDDENRGSYRQRELNDYHGHDRMDYDYNRGYDGSRDGRRN
jgi:hypothetical protein